jgi:response regulator of citrate/malate metabolism
LLPKIIDRTIHSLSYQFVSVRVQNQGAPVSMEHLAQASNYARHSLRYLEMLPECEFHQFESVMIPNDDIVEITCIWKNKFNEPYPF